MIHKISFAPNINLLPYLYNLNSKCSRYFIAKPLYLYTIMSEKNTQHPIPAHAAQHNIILRHYYIWAFLPSCVICGSKGWTFNILVMG